MVKGSLTIRFENGEEKEIPLDGAISLHIETRDQTMDIDFTKLQLPKSNSAFQINNLTINA